MISAVPSSDDMLGVHALSIGSRGKGTHPNGGPKSSRANWQPRPKLIPALKPSPPSPQRWRLRHRHPTVTAGRAGNDVGLRALVAVESPVDAAMGGESADSDSAGMDVDSQPPASKRGRRSQGKEQQTPAMPRPQRSRRIMARGA